MKLTFKKLGRAQKTSYKYSIRCSLCLNACFVMSKETKEKPKKKKIIKKEPQDEVNSEKTENIQDTNTEYGQGNPKKACEPAKKPTSESPVENWRKTQESRERGVSTQEGFYIAHPRNVKRTAHFKDVHSRKLSELLEAFHMFDFDRDGVINRDDLKKTFASLCIETDEEEIDQMLSEGLHPLNFDAFVILLGYKTLDLDPEEVLLDAFSNWDDNQEGLISYDRFLQHIMAWGDKFTEEEATAALADASIVLNKTKEKMIDYIQFSDLCGLRKMMQKRTNEGEN